MLAGSPIVAPIVAATLPMWPPNLATEQRRRLKAFDALAKSPVDQARMQNKYRNDPVAWINDWCVTFDPRRNGAKKIPFILFPKQVEFIEFLWEMYQTGENGLVEKCRDIGATWLCCAFSVWLWLYHPGVAIGWGSRKKELVDNRGDPKAIFTKIRQIIKNLPEWMLPEGFDWRLHSADMRLINPETEATIIGECGDQIGRGGRTSIYFKDESAHYERPEGIEAALGDNTNVQIDISSVNGSANIFYRRRMAGREWKSGIHIDSGLTRVFIFDWRHHPAKTQEWYDKRRKKAESEGLLHIFAQEVDRDYSGSVEGVIIPAAWVRAALDAHIVLASRLPEIQRDPYLASWFAGERTSAQDVADGGGDLNANVGRHGVVARYAEMWGGEAGDAPQTAIPLCIENHMQELYYDSIGVGSAFKTTVNRMMELPTWPMYLRVMKWDASAAPLDPTDPVIPGDPESPTNEDTYGNMKAQAWFRLRARFYKVFKAVTTGEAFPVDEMISLSSEMPNVHQLILELSQPTKKTSLTNGKTIVDKKPDGARSPNLADALVMCFNPTREVGILDVL